MVRLVGNRRSKIVKAGLQLMKIIVFFLTFVGGAVSLILSTIGIQNFTMKKNHPSQVGICLSWLQATRRAVKRTFGDGNKSKQRLRLDEMALNELQRSNESAVWKKQEFFHVD